MRRGHSGGSGFNSIPDKENSMCKDPEARRNSDSLITLN